MKPIIMSTPSEENSEIWKAIKGYEGRYEISNYGRVKSLPKQKQRNTIILKHWIGNKGYHYIDLRYADRKKKTHSIHGLVLEHFDCERPNGKLALHNDDNKDNNHIDNLRWGSAKDNAEDRRRNGRTASGENNGAAKLDQKCVKIIKRLESTLTSGDVAYLACVTSTTIERIWKGESWKEE